MLLFYLLSWEWVVSCVSLAARDLAICKSVGVLGGKAKLTRSLSEVTFDDVISVSS